MLKIDFTTICIHSQCIQNKIYAILYSHERFLLIDEKIYHLGISHKDLGKKWFVFSFMTENSFGLKKKIRRYWMQSSYHYHLTSQFLNFLL